MYNIYVKKNNKTEKSKIRFYVMYGFNVRDEHEKIGYLKINSIQENKYSIYSIVKSNVEASVFPSCCNNKKLKKHFATPEKWAEFFNSEKELENWKFHPIPSRQKK